MFNVDIIVLNTWVSDESDYGAKKTNQPCHYFVASIWIDGHQNIFFTAEMDFSILRYLQMILSFVWSMPLPYRIVSFSFDFWEPMHANI